MNELNPHLVFIQSKHIPKEEELAELIKWIKENSESMVAVGEVGLPYYLHAEKKGKGGIHYQPYIELLRKMIALSVELDKPIVLHAVYEDAEIVCNLLEEYGVKNAHFHWFKGDERIVRRMITNGYFISITPDVLYEEEIQQLVLQYPLAQIMIETDGPWRFEGPFSGQMTHPRMMRESIKKIAEIKQISMNEVEDVI